MSAIDRQVGGSHYREMPIQPWQFIEANDMGFAEGNIVKYVSRWRHKNGIEDLRKTVQYLEMVLEAAPFFASVRKCGARFSPTITAHLYITDNGLDGLEAAIIRWVYFWIHNRQIESLEIARSKAIELIAQANGEA